MVQRIRRMITLGEVLPGEHLPTEHSVLQGSSADGHDAVIEAILARDAEQAMRAMDEHIRAAWQEILAAIGEPPS